MMSLSDSRSGDMIVARQEHRLGGAHPLSLLHFHRGQVLAIGADAVALYRDAAAIADPLGNGLIGHEPIPAALRPSCQPVSGYVREQRAGFVGLHGGAVLFIRPDGIALFASNDDALHNRNAYWLMPFVRVH